MKLNGTEVTIDLTKHYPNGRQAILINTIPDNGPYMTASVNLPDNPCPEGEVWVKDYAENTGITRWLIEQDVIEPGARDEVQTGFVSISRYKLKAAA